MKQWLTPYTMAKIRPDNWGMAKFSWDRNRLRTRYSPTSFPESLLFFGGGEKKWDLGNEVGKPQFNSIQYFEGNRGDMICDLVVWRGTNGTEMQQLPVNSGFSSVSNWQISSSTSNSNTWISGSFESAVAEMTFSGYEDDESSLYSSPGKSAVMLDLYGHCTQLAVLLFLLCFDRYAFVCLLLVLFHLFASLSYSITKQFHKILGTYPPTPPSDLT